MQPARTLESILTELSPVYDPQIQNYRTRQAEIPKQIAAEEQGLGAKQERAFGDILGGARRRGLGFSGIPLGEQAKYTATEYLPALARLRQSGREQALSLEDAILGINERRQNQALGIRQYEQQRYDAFQEAERQRRASAAASATNNSWLSALTGQGAAGAPKAPGKTDPIQQIAYNDVATRIQAQSNEELKSDYFATAASAKNGNQKDLYKLQLYRQLRPDLFKFSYGWEKTGGQFVNPSTISNYSQLSF